MDPVLALTHTSRRLARRPGWTALVVVTLGLGIAAATAIFSVVDTLVLRPLPYPDPERLVVLRESSPVSPMVPLTAAVLEHLRGATHSLEAIEAFDPISFHLAAAEGAERVPGALVSPGFFELFGGTASAGRLLAAEDARTGGGAQPIVLGHVFWQRRFGGDSDVIGEQLRLSWTAPFGPRRSLGETFVVVGVLAEEFRSPYGAADVWAPLVLPEPPAYREASYLFGFGRLGAGVHLDEARAELGELLRGLGPDGLPSTAGPLEALGVTVLPLAEQGVAQVRAALWIVFAAVGLVMLVACANVANLLLLRRDERQGELFVRSALGASRGRLAAELALDGAMLGLAAGAAGLAVAWSAVRWFGNARPGLLPREHEVVVDGRVALFAAAAAAVAVLLFAVLPALPSGRAAARGSRGVARRDVTARTRGLLVGLEVALAMLLLVGAGLLTRSFDALARTDLGFAIDRLMTFEVALPPARYPEPAQRAALLRSAVERLRALPGVRGAAVASSLPLTPINTATPVTVAGRSTEDGRPGAATYRLVGEGYFETLGIPVLEGRPFAAGDVVAVWARHA
ncbi:MAG TPA: ABC transporter permease [Thermoanaerobaculia bacterium]|nr:ABC transporter permease [Thermoanaerobaculia bacterium]